MGGCLSTNFPALPCPFESPGHAPRAGTPALVHHPGMCGAVQGCRPARTPGRGLAPTFPAPTQTNTAPRDPWSKAHRVSQITWELALSGPCHGHMSSLHPQGQEPPQWGTQSGGYLLPCYLLLEGGLFPGQETTCMFSLLPFIFQQKQQGQGSLSFGYFVPALNKSPLTIVATSQDMTRQTSPHLPTEPFAVLGVARRTDLAPSLPRGVPISPLYLAVPAAPSSMVMAELPHP